MALVEYSTTSAGPAVPTGSCPAVQAAAAAVHSQSPDGSHARVVARRMKKVEKRREVETAFNQVFALMAVVFALGVIMLACNAYVRNKGVKTYKNYNQRVATATKGKRSRRDWDQGIWAGVLVRNIITRGLQWGQPLFVDLFCLLICFVCLFV